MNKNSYEIKYQACNLCNALHRNINDNYESISFVIFENGNIQVKIVLEKKTEVEDQYIDDMIAEFSAMQTTDCIIKPVIVTGKKNLPLNNLVYQKSDSKET